MGKTYLLYFFSGIFAVVLLICPDSLWAAFAEPTSTEAQQKLDAMAVEPEPAQRRAVAYNADALIDKLPDDNTPQYGIDTIRISGNTRISTESLLARIPDVYDASGLKEPQAASLFDLRPIKAVLAEPETVVSVSARSIQGFTQYLLSQYQRRGYAGIYVYVPAEAFEPDRELDRSILPIRILEATVDSVGTAYYDVDNQPVEKGYLRADVLKGWSPVKPGEVANRRRMDEYINLLNLNPDRYVAATVSQGAEPNSLAIDYRVYEANPWHFFVQLDNAGTRDTQWTPRLGLINTNLFGFDDRLTAIWQTTPDKTWRDEYAVFGSYDFPVFSPRLRLNVFAGHNEFAITAPGILDFLGRGSFVGGMLRYNLFQAEKWFFDVTGTLSYEESKITPSLFPEFLTSDVHLTLWGLGADLYRSDDRTDTRLSFRQLSTLNGSSNREFGLARGGAQRNATVLRTTARHSRYLDTDNVQRLSGTFQWIYADDRLPPSRMTPFGGMYSVRGYDEYEIIADGGVLASAQYEYDVIRKMRVDAHGQDAQAQQGRPFVRKVAPLAFFDYGHARIESPLPTDDRRQDLASVGGGVIVELGDNFTGTVYYGYPLVATDNTRSGKGRVNAGLLFRW